MSKREEFKALFSKSTKEKGFDSLDFVIVAPPRSGTAWISNYLSTPHSFCFHEAIPASCMPNSMFHSDTVGNIRNAFPGILVGNADATYGMFPEMIPDDAKVVMIKRAKSSVISSARKIGFPDKGIALIYKGLEEFEASGRADTTLEFDDFFKNGDAKAVLA